jgi:hypothetical protein
MNVLFWLIWCTTAFTLTIFWTVQFQLHADYASLPSLRARKTDDLVQLPLQTLNPHVALCSTFTHRFTFEQKLPDVTTHSGGLILPHIVLANLLKLPLGSVKAPRMKNMPSPRGDCLFDRRGTRPDMYRTTPESWLKFGQSLSPLGLENASVFTESKIMSELVCNAMYHPSQAGGSALVPYRADIHNTFDFLHCTERLQSQNRTWAGFYCQVHPQALLDVCPDLETAQKSTCSAPSFEPLFRPGCCERILNDASFFTISSGDGDAYFIQHDDSTDPSEFTLVNGSGENENLTDTFTLASYHTPDGVQKRILRANLLPLTMQNNTVKLENGTLRPFVDFSLAAPRTGPSTCNGSVSIGSQITISRAVLTCTTQADITSGNYICLKITTDSPFLHAEFRSTPCPSTSAYQFTTQNGTGLLYNGNSPVCSNASGLYVARSTSFCANDAGVFMYPTQIQDFSNSHARPVATALGVFEQTKNLVNFAQWRVDPEVRRVYLTLPSDPLITAFATALHREPGTALWPGALGWFQRVSQAEYVGVDLDPILIAEHAATPQSTGFTLEYAAPGFAFFSNASKGETGLYKTRSPQFTRVHPIPPDTVPIFDESQWSVVPGSGLVQNVLKDAKNFELLPDSCASETLHVHSTLFFSQKTCAEAYAHLHWQVYSSGKSGYCAQDFIPKIVNGSFICEAPEANGGAQVHNGYFWIEGNQTELVGTNFSNLGYDSIILAVGHFPNQYTLDGSGNITGWNCAIAPKNESKTKTYEHLTGVARLNLTTSFENLCRHYFNPIYPVITPPQKETIEEIFDSPRFPIVRPAFYLETESTTTTPGWIGTRSFATQQCLSYGNYGNFIKTEFTRSESDIHMFEILGGAQNATHKWPQPALYLSNAVANEEHAPCVERGSRFKALRQEMVWAENMFLENNIRPTWAFSNLSYLNDNLEPHYQCLDFYGGNNCPYELPPAMAAFSRVHYDSMASDLTCNQWSLAGWDAPRCWGSFTLEITDVRNSEKPELLQSVPNVIAFMEGHTMLDVWQDIDMQYFRRGYQAYIIYPPGEQNRIFTKEKWLSIISQRMDDGSGSTIDYHEVSLNTFYDNYASAFSSPSVTSSGAIEDTNIQLISFLIDNPFLCNAFSTNADKLWEATEQKIIPKSEFTTGCENLHYFWVECQAAGCQTKYRYNELKIEAVFGYKFIWA